METVSTQEVSHAAVPTRYRVAEGLPFIVYADEDRSVAGLREELRRHRGWFAAKLQKHGALLFRGFDVNEAQDFEDIALEIDPELQNDYMGTSPRDAVTKYVFTASELPGYYPIPQHCEMTFIAKPPRRVFFSCLVEPPEGSGETPLADFRKVYRDLDPDVRARFDEKGIRIVRNYRGPGEAKSWELGQLKGWDEMFKTTDRAEVERQCERENFTPVWGEDNSLRLISSQPASKAHPQTGEQVWYNHSQVFHTSAAEGEFRRIFKMRPSLRHLGLWLLGSAFMALQRSTKSSEQQAMHCTYGDGTEIPNRDMEAVRDAIWKNLVVTSWRKGDVVAIDNDSTAHGRLPYKGPRLVTVAWA